MGVGNQAPHGSEAVKIEYTVFSCDEVDIMRDVDIDGDAQSVAVPGLSVQLTAAGQGTINLSLSAAQAKDHSFKAGKKIVVTFGDSV